MPQAESAAAAHCPKCRRPSHAPSAANPHAWYCHHCRMEFEAGDDGDIAYGRPSKRLEREEARQALRRAKQQR